MSGVLVGTRALRIPPSPGWTPSATTIPEPGIVAVPYWPGAPCNSRPADALYHRAFSVQQFTRSPRLLGGAPGPGNTHRQALRALGNRLVGILDGCLRHREKYNEQIAWPTPIPVAA